MAFMDYMPQWGQNTQDVSGAPVDDTLMQLQLKRKLALSDALRQQAAPQGQMVSGHYVAPSWTQYLANAVNKYTAGQQEQEAMKQYGQAQQAKQQKLVDLLQGKEVTSPMDYTEAGNIPGMEQTIRQPYSQQEFMAKAVQAMPDLAPKLIESQVAQYGKEEQPISLGEGGILVNRKGEVIAQNPKAAKEERILGNVNPSDFTPESLAKFAQSGGKDYSVLQRIEKPQAPVTRQMRVGSMDVTQQWNPQTNTWSEIARGPAWNPQGDTNKPPAGYTWTPQGGLSAIPGGPADKSQVLKPVPAATAGGFVENQNAINKIDNAIRQVQQTPDSSFGLKNVAGDTIMQRLDPKGAAARAAISGVAGQKFHDISGAAVSATEANRLKPYIPSSQDTKENILQKLQNMKSEYANTNALIQGQFGESQGYKPLQQQNIPIAPSAPAQQGWSIKKVQ